MQSQVDFFNTTDCVIDIWMFQHLHMCPLWFVLKIHIKKNCIIISWLETIVQFPEL